MSGAGTARISRRDLLKLAGAMAVRAAAPWPAAAAGARAGRRPNIIVILCDSLSARHCSLYGYARRTTPHLEAFAARSTVFHRHYSGANFTTPGTASLFTGMVPWKHGAMNQGGLVRREFAHCNPYRLLGPEYRRLAFSQNPWIDRMLGQFRGDVDRFLPPTAFSLREWSSPLRLFRNDRALASIAIEDFLLPVQEGSVAGSAVVGYLNKRRILSGPGWSGTAGGHEVAEVMDSWSQVSYLNEQVYRGVHEEVSRLAAGSLPYFAYFHLYSPHYPYRPRGDHRARFQDDGYVLVPKPPHPLSPGYGEDYLNRQCALYDGLVAEVDEEFGRLVARLERDGVLEDSYLIFTSDHGELFERGFLSHGSVLLYESVLQIPLVVHAPGQTKRADVRSLTSNIDLLPTLLAFAGRGPAPEVDGRVLPGFGGPAADDRPVFSVFAEESSAFGPLRKAVVCVHQGEHKLIAYLGYGSFDQVFELYDLARDPEEMRDLASTDAATLAAMKRELFRGLDAAGRAWPGPR